MFYLVPLTVFVGLLISPIIIWSVSKTPGHPAATKSNAHQLAKPAGYTLAKVSQPENLDQVLPDSNDQSKLFAIQFLQNLPLSYDCLKQKCVALTFDDGPNKDSTKLILDKLSDHYAHATFFEIGNRIAGNEEVIKRMYAEGNDIGNHSYSHPSFLKLNPKQIRQQVSLTQKAITAAGVPAPYLFRPPYEDFLLSMQKDIGLAVVLWNVDPKDWDYQKPEQIAKIIKQQIRPGAIVVLHDRVATAQALDKVFKDLSGEYKFVTVSQLLGLNADSKGVYVGQ